MQSDFQQQQQMRGAFSPIPPPQQPQQPHQPHQPQQPQQPQQFQQYDQSNLYGNFNQNPTAQLGMQFANTAFHSLNTNVQHSVNRYVSLSQLKPYFDVTNLYVLQKLKVLLFPWTHKSWHRYSDRDQSGQVVGYKSPREDRNSPDLYIPVMALVTYVVCVGVIIGRLGVFRPEDLGYTASTAMGVVGLEVVLVKMFCYLLSVGEDLKLLDVVAYSGYKFVSVLLVLVVKPMALPWWVLWGAFGYCGCGLAFFMIRSLRYALIPMEDGGLGTQHRKRRVHFLFVIAMMQFCYLWLLIQYKTIK